MSQNIIHLFKKPFRNTETIVSWLDRKSHGTWVIITGMEGANRVLETLKGIAEKGNIFL